MFELLLISNYFDITTSNCGYNISLENLIAKRGKIEKIESERWNYLQ